MVLMSRARPRYGEAPLPARQAGDRALADRTCRHRPRSAMTRPAGTVPDHMDPASLDGTGRGRDTRALDPSRFGRSGREGVELAALDHRVDDPVLLGLLGREDLVAVDVGADLLRRAAGVPRQDLLHLGAHPLDLRGVDLQVGDLTAGLTGGLVDQHARVRQREALAGGAGSQQDGGGRGGLAHADGLDVGPDEHHRVVDGHQRGEGATGRVDVDRDVAVGVVGLQRDQLGHHVVGRRVVDLHPEEDDALLEELVVRVGLLHAVARALHEGGQDVTAGGHLEAHVSSPNPQLSVTGLLLSVLAALLTPWWTNPYSSASAAVNQRSRSESFSICSTGWPVCSDWSWFSSVLVRRNRSAWMAMSDAVPPTPADGWCIMIRACGRA